MYEELPAYVAAGEVTALEHELRDDAVELAAGVAEALLAGAEGAEVLGGLGDDVVEELEVDAAGAGYNTSQQLDRHQLDEVGDGLPCSDLSRLVMLPDWSTWALGPVQEQSK